MTKIYKISVELDELIAKYYMQPNICKTSEKVAPKKEKEEMKIGFKMEQSSIQKIKNMVSYKKKSRKKKERKMEFLTVFLFYLLPLLVIPFFSKKELNK